MQKFEVIIVGVLSAYFTYFLGIGSTLAFFAGWGLANVFEHMRMSKTNKML